MTVYVQDRFNNMERLLVLRSKYMKSTLLVFSALFWVSTVSAQLNVRAQAGVDIDTNATLGITGLLYPISSVLVGAN